jgi:radical SAM superfamily enzyme YgiQ (UPF0313 family)
LKIVIVNPLWSFINYPPVNIAELAGYLIKNGLKNTKITDLNFEIKNKFQVGNLIAVSVKKILQQHPDAICISCNAVQFPFVCELSLAIKSKNKIPVLIGGVMPSLDPELVLKMSNADYVIRGEGEQTTLEILTNINNKEQIKYIKGLSYRAAGGKLIHNADRELIDINKLPLPAFHLISRSLKNCSDVWLTASRGCAYKCKFCSGNDMWKFQRRKNPTFVAAQLQLLKTKYGLKNFIFGDDCLTLNKKWAQELCEKIKPLKLKWGCLSRIDSIDEEILCYLKKSGCNHIYHGIESGSAQVRHQLDKKMKNNNNKKISDIIQKELKLGFNITCSFMTGIPFETQKNIVQTFNFAKQLQKLGVKIQLWMLTPYHGLKLLNEYKEQLCEIDRLQYGLQQDIFDKGQIFLYSKFINKYKKYNPDNFIFLPKDIKLDKFVQMFHNIQQKLGLVRNKKQLTGKEIFILKNIKNEFYFNNTMLIKM